MLTAPHMSGTPRENLLLTMRIVKRQARGERSTDAGRTDAARSKISTATGNENYQWPVLSSGFRKGLLAPFEPANAARPAAPLTG
jgi:hypothetical protein